MKGVRGLSIRQASDVFRVKLTKSKSCESGNGLKTDTGNGPHAIVLKIYFPHVKTRTTEAQSPQSSLPLRSEDALIFLALNELASEPGQAPSILHNISRV